MDSKIKIALIFAGFIAVGLALGIWQQQKTKPKLASQHQTQSTTPTQKPGAVVFQPEGQMLTQAMDAKAAASSATTSPTAQPGLPASAKASQTPYSYDSKQCQASSAPYLCLAKFYQDLTGNYGADTAIKDIKFRYNQNATVASDCHPLMHVIGRTAAQSYATASQAFKHGDVFCWSGYYHGILEGMVNKIGLKNLPKELNNICSDIPGKASYNFEYYNCVHGLGHGIMAQLDDEVFDSLKMCDNLNGNWEQQSCYSGVFMQNIIDSTNVADTGNVVKYLKPAQPLYPCTAVETKYKEQCYLGQTSYALQVTNYNFKKIFDLCATVEQPYRGICNQSMGRDVANQSYHQAQTTKDGCYIPSNSNDRANCVIGAVKEIISYYHAINQAKDFCNILDDADKSTCSATADSYYAQL